MTWKKWYILTSISCAGWISLLIIHFVAHISNDTIGWWRGFCLGAFIVLTWWVDPKDEPE